MTVYCPNCGKPNTDEATQCVSCGTALSKPEKKAGSKFKGTMMMAGVSAPKPPAPGGGGGGGPKQGPGVGQPPAEGGGKKDLAFQQTMLGPMTPPPGQAPGQPQPGQPQAGQPPAGAPQGG